jgi:hypothetical protein
MKTHLKQVVACSVAVGMFLSGQALAATNPTDAGETSTGSSSMSVTIPPLVKITGIDDLFTDNNPDWTGNGAGLSDSDDVCIYSNMDSGGTRDYRVTMTGSGDTNTTFKLECTTGDCSGDQIAYTPYWNDVSGTDSGETQVGTAAGDTQSYITGQTGWSRYDDCQGSDTARFRVFFTDQEMLDNKGYGTYTGTLTILITPEPS